MLTPVGAVAVLEESRPTQLLPGDPFGNRNQQLLTRASKQNCSSVFLSLLGMEQQVKELGGEKKIKIESEIFWRRTSIKHLCKGHSDIPFPSVIPQDFNSAEWASLRRPSLSSL